MVACLLYRVFSINQEWWPATEFMFYGLRHDEKNYDDFYSWHWFKRYCQMLYQSAIQFSLVEICPRTEIELAFVAVCMILSAMINALLFGIFAELLAVLAERSSRFQEKMDNANSAMCQVELSDELRKNVRGYFFKTEESRAQKDDWEAFEENLSQTQIKLVTKQLFTRVLNDSHFFCFIRYSCFHNHTKLIDTIEKRGHVTPQNR